MWPTGPDGCPLRNSEQPPARRSPKCAIFAGESEQFHAGANTRTAFLTVWWLGWPAFGSLVEHLLGNG